MGQSEFAPAGLPPGATPLECAYHFLGVREDVGRPNRGPQIDEWLRAVYLEPDAGPPAGYPWCAAFVSAMCALGGRPLRPSASVARIWDVNRQLRTSGPLQPGDVCIHLSPTGSHTGFFVRQVSPGVIETLDGNTNDQGGREGTMVAIRQRIANYWTGFLRPVAA